MKHDFIPYWNPVFIETGTADGAGVLAAMKAGFSRIYSIELSIPYYTKAATKFLGINEISILFGDSRNILPDLLKGINQKCTFWLDAHWCGGESEGEFKQVPLLEELTIIGSHHIKDHTILIDDIRLIKNAPPEWGGFSICTCDLEERIHAINSNYKVTYEYGEEEKDILVAMV